MNEQRKIHSDLKELLKRYDDSLINEFVSLRSFILKMYPDANELLYHTHAITTVFSTSLKLSDAFCMIPIYTKHFNLGFNKGTLLNDHVQLLHGTGKFIRHIPVKNEEDYNSSGVINLIQQAIQLALDDMEPKDLVKGQIVSKI